MTASALDWARIDDWTTQIVAGELGAVTRAFARHGADPPELIWDPRPDQMTAPPLRFLAEHWLTLGGADQPPHVRRIDALELQPALGYAMLLDPVDGGRDFRYRLYGTVVTDISRLDMTGRLASEHPASRYVIEFLMAVNRAALVRRRAVYTARNPVGAEETARWLRLALPFVDDTGQVTRLLAGTVAVRGDGRMVR